MMSKVYVALIASVGAVTLLLAANETFAASGTPRGTLVATPATAHPLAARPFAAHPFLARRFNRRNLPLVYWPGGGSFDEPSFSEPFAGLMQPPSNDVRYTYVYDVPWDWAHRYPPNVTPSDRPYVPSCPSETVTVPGRGGEEQTVNIMRCY